MNRFRSVLLTLLMLASSMVMADAFDNGIEAFNRGDYEAALKAFEQARREGRNDDRLWYNLGSTLYRLGDYHGAGAAFARIPADSSLWQAARYNLGLVAEKLGRRDEARRHYREARSVDRDNGIGLLAARQLAALDQAQTHRAGSAFLRLSLGNDDNVNFAPLGIGSSRSEQFVDLFASGRYFLSGGYRHGWALDGRATLTDYTGGKTFDYSEAVLGVSHYRPLGDWRSRLGIEVTKSNYGGSAYQTIGSGLAEVTLPLAERKRFRLSLRYDGIQSDNSAYDYLKGSRARLGAMLYRFLPADFWRVEYRLELNHRKDLSVASYSPTRNELRGRYQRNLSGDWVLDGRLAWRHSSYPQAVIGKRKDDRYRVGLELVRKLRKRTRLRLGYEHTSNRSNIDNVVVGGRTYGYSYTRNIFRISLDHRF